MTYKIIGDSCTDLTEELKKDPHFQTIPLTLQVGSIQVVDDETFDQKKFLELVKSSPECPKTACPSPEVYKEAFECEADHIFVITLSEHLSGSYNSAMLGKRLYEEEYGEDRKNIAVFSSDSASSGQMNMALYIQELCEEDLPFEEIVKRTLRYREGMHTYFVLESLDTLRKNGRLTGLQAFFATALNIKPVMGADHGVIIKLDQARGINKALVRMCEIIRKETENSKEKRLVIAHCNNRARAELVREELMKHMEFREILITETAGVATVYASDGGIVVAI
ncbi:DegV family protein [Clostridium sp. AM58-1XD]|uniref:DegV family protein n=1 Tax=Clostridium sp. AM58-1XD TaxID=2292307 RepID=UPI000E4AF6F1|nr:DegV family protein [Clostridium sp. AM58-1XD]RGZ00888.1 DegV family protein [Clostridium sp. AM58-1XD]